MRPWSFFKLRLTMGILGCLFPAVGQIRACHSLKHALTRRTSKTGAVHIPGQRRSCCIDPLELNSQLGMEANSDLRHKQHQTQSAAEQDCKETHCRTGHITYRKLHLNDSFLIRWKRGQSLWEIFDLPSLFRMLCILQPWKSLFKRTIVRYGQNNSTKIVQ